MLLEQIARKDEIDELLKILKARQSYINQFGGIEQFINGVYGEVVPLRGILPEPSSIAIKEIRALRRPKNTNKALHQLVDDAFYKLFNFRYRSSSAFVTTSQANADDYGSPFVIIPATDRFKVCYSPTVEDLFTKRVEILQHVIGEKPSKKLDMYDARMEWIKEQVKKLETLSGAQWTQAVNSCVDWLKESKYTETTDMYQAGLAARGNEMMITGHSYYAIRPYLFKTHSKRLIEELK